MFGPSAIQYRTNGGNREPFVRYVPVAHSRDRRRQFRNFSMYWYDCCVVDNAPHNSPPSRRVHTYDMRTDAPPNEPSRSANKIPYHTGDKLTHPVIKIIHPPRTIVFSLRLIFSTTGSSSNTEQCIVHGNTSYLDEVFPKAAIFVVCAPLTHVLEKIGSEIHP